MQIIGKCLTIAEFKKYCSKKDFSPNNPNKLVIHHTYKPDVKDWNGSKTISGLKRYYEGLQWSNGPHLFIAEDGIWLFTDMKTQGIHAGTGNTRSIGIEVVGDYDGKAWKGKTKDNAVGAIIVLLDKLKLKFEDIHFHSEYSKKTCPGKIITKKWLKDKIASALKASTPKAEPIVVKVPEKVIETPVIAPQQRTESIPDSLEEYLEKPLQDSIHLEPEKLPTPELVKLSELPKVEPTLLELIINFIKLIFKK